MKTGVIKAITLIAAISLICFIAMGMVLVIIQLFSVLTLNGALAASLGTLKSLAIAISVVLGVLSLILSYINRRSNMKIKENEQ